MWAAEAKARIDIPIGENIEEWTNEQFKKFIISRKNTNCSEFLRAIYWLKKRNYKEAIRDCDELLWLNWLKTNIPKSTNTIIKRDESITITKGKNYEYALWCGAGIYDLPGEYVGEITRILSKQ